MRLIDADNLKQEYGMKDDCADCEKETKGKVKSCKYGRVYTLMDFCGWIDDMPTIEPERKKGKWILVTDNRGQHFECDHCENGDIIKNRNSAASVVQT